MTNDTSIKIFHEYDPKVIELSLGTQLIEQIGIQKGHCFKVAKNCACVSLRIGACALSAVAMLGGTWSTVVRYQNDNSLEAALCLYLTVSGIYNLKENGKPLCKIFKSRHNDHN